MDLHRSRKLLVGALFLLIGGVALFVATRAGVAADPGSSRWVIRQCIGAGAALLGAAFLVRELRPFMFRIGAAGLTLRASGINRPVPWTEVEMIIMNQPVRAPEDKSEPTPVLLLVPVAGSPLADRLDQRSPLDQRPCREVLDTGDTKESADDIAAALAHFAAGRFVDARR